MTGEFFSLSCKITAGTSIAQGVFTHLSIHSSKGISSPRPPSRRWKQLLTHLIMDAWLYLSVLDIHGKSETVRSRFLRILWFVRKVSLETVATTEAGVPRSSVLILLLWDGGSCVSQMPSAKGKCPVNGAILDFFTAHGPAHVSQLSEPHTASSSTGPKRAHSTLSLDETLVRCASLPHCLAPKVFGREFQPIDRREVNIYQYRLLN